MARPLDLFDLLGVSTAEEAARRWRGRATPALMNYLRRVVRFADVHPGASSGRVGLSANLIVLPDAALPDALPLTLPQIPDLHMYLRPTHPSMPARLFVTKGATGDPEWVVESLPVELRFPAGMLEPLEREGADRVPSEQAYPTSDYDFDPRRLDALKIVLRYQAESSVYVRVRVHMTPEGDVVFQPAVPISVGPCRFLGVLPCFGLHDLSIVPSPRLSAGQDQRQLPLEWTRHPLGNAPTASPLLTVRSVDVDVSRRPLSDLMQRVNRQRQGHRIEFVVEDLAVPLGGRSVTPLPIPVHGRVGIRRDRTTTTDPKALEEYDLTADPIKLTFGSVQLWIQQLYLQTPGPGQLPVNAQIAFVRSSAAPEELRNPRRLAEAAPRGPALTVEVSDQWFIGLGLRSVGSQPMVRSERAGRAEWRVTPNAGVDRDDVIVTGERIQELRLPGIELFRIPALKIALTGMGFRFGAAIERLCAVGSGQYSVPDALQILVDIGIFSTERTVTARARWGDSVPFSVDTTSGRPLAIVLRDVGWDRGRISMPRLGLPEGVRLKAFRVFTVGIEDIGWVTEPNGGYYFFVSGGVELNLTSGTTPSRRDERRPSTRRPGGGIWVDRLRVLVGGDRSAPPFLLDGVSLSIRAGPFELDGYGGYRDQRFEVGTPEEHRIEEFGLGLRVAFRACGKDFLVALQVLLGSVKWAERPERDLRFWLAGLRVSPIPIGTFQLTNVRLLAGSNIEPQLEDSRVEGQDMRLLEWYTGNETVLNIPDNRQLRAWRREAGALTLGIGAGLSLPVGNTITIDLFFLFTTSPRERGLLVLLRVYVLRAEDPVGYGALELDLVRDKWSFLVGVDLNLAQLLGLRNAPRVLTLTGTLYAGNKPGTFALGQLNDQASWLTLALEWRFGLFAIDVRVGLCVQLVEGGPNGAGFILSARGMVSVVIAELQIYFTLGVLVGSWRSESKACGVRVWAELGVRIRLFWIFTFGISARAEIEALSSSLAYRRVVAELTLETPWWLPDVTWRYEKVWETPLLEHVEVVAPPLSGASAGPEGGERRSLQITPLRLGQPQTAVYHMEALRALDQPQYDEAAESDPVSVDSMIALDFKPAVSDRLAPGENTPLGAGREPSESHDSNVTLAYELISLSVLRRPRFGPRAAEPPAELQSAIESELTDPSDPRRRNGRARFEPHVPLAWDRDLVNDGRLDPRRLLVNSEVPFSFLTGNAEADETHARAEPGWPCSTVARAALPRWHELRYDDLPSGTRAPVLRRFPGTLSALQWAIAPSPVVAPSRYGRQAGRPVARIDLSGRTGLTPLATIAFDAPACAIELEVGTREGTRGRLFLRAFRNLALVREDPILLLGGTPAGPASLNLPEGATAVVLEYEEGGEGSSDERVVLEFIAARYLALYEEFDRETRAGREEATSRQVRAGSGKLAWLPNHNYELEMTVRVSLSHNRSATAPQVALIRQKTRFRTKGVLGLNAVRRTGEELEPYVESWHPRPPAELVYRTEPVSVAFTPGFNVLVPVAQLPRPDDPAERHQLLELVLTVARIGGGTGSVHLSRAGEDWLTVHRAPELSTLVLDAAALAATLVTPAVRRAPTLDPLRQRFDRALANPEGCAQSPLPAVPSLTLTHAPFDRGEDAVPGAWAASDTFRASVQPKGGPFVHRPSFVDGDETALTPADGDGREGSPWEVRDGRLTVAAPLPDIRHQALFGERTWEHLELAASVVLTPGGAAGLAIGVSGPPVTRGIAALVTDDGSGEPPMLRVIEWDSGSERELIEPGATAGGKRVSTRAETYALTLTAFDDAVRATVGDATIQVPRGGVRAGRAALVARASIAFTSLAVQPLEMYGFTFRTSRFARFEDHIAGAGEVRDIPAETPGPDVAAEVTLASLLTPTVLAEARRAMARDASPAERQHVFGDWVRRLALPLRPSVDRLEVSWLKRDGSAELFLLESPEPLQCSRDVNIRLEGGHSGSGAVNTLVLGNGDETSLLVVPLDPTATRPLPLRGRHRLVFTLERPRFRGAGSDATYAAQATIELDLRSPATLVHRVADGERHTSALPTTVDNPDAVVLATPCWNPGGVKEGVYNDHPIGVYWDGFSWAVFNQDLAPIPSGAAFNVSIDRGFVHRADSGNTYDNTTTIHHASLDARPDAVLLVTAHWNPGGQKGVYLPHPVGVYYTGKHWAIFTQDRSAMPLGAGFSFFHAPDGFVHTAQETTISGHWTTLDHPRLNGNPDALALVTPNWNPASRQGVYHDHHIGLLYTGERWAVYNQDLAPMVVGTSFNVWVAP